MQPSLPEVSEHWRRLDHLFAAALPLSASDQEAFVAAEAGDDPQLASQLLNMLQNHRKSFFLDAGIRPAVNGIFGGFPIGQTMGPYSVRGSLGQGGMGVVYLAEHTEWHCPVAIKIPRDGWISPESRNRFAAEQRVLAQLTHPAVARIYEGGTGPNGTPWFAMEFVEGEPITAFAFSRNLSVRERLELFRQACEAVQYAHSQAIIHRDIKPSNILVTAAAQVKLLDFGIAKQMEAIDYSATRTGAHPLTLAYAAPEQIKENRVSVQSDIYSLGVTLYELLTGRPPFEFGGLSPSEAEHLLFEKEPDKPSAVSKLQLGRSEWADLDLLILMALHRDAARRYLSVDALLRDVDHFLNQEPLDARPDSVSYRVGKFIRRRKLPVIAASVACIVILLMASYFTWRIARARDEAVAQAEKTSQVQQFMTDLLAGGDDVNGPTKDLRVIDVLALGITKARQFDKDPLIQGEIYRNVGTIYQSLGDFKNAGKLLHLALARLTAAVGERSKEVAETLVNIGALQNDLGQYQQADSLERRAIAIARQLRPAPVVMIARYELILVASLIHERQYATALTILKADEPIQMAHPEAHDDWLANLNLQATINIHLHHYGEAERLTGYLIADDRKQHLSLTPEDAHDFVNMGQIQEAQSRFADAEQSYRQALRIEESWRVAGHPEIASMRRLLAQSLQEEGKNEEATDLARLCLSDLEHAYGHWHNRVAYILRLLFRLAYDRHDLLEARTDVNKEIEIYRKIGNAADLPAALTNLAYLDLKEGDYVRGESHVVEAISEFPATEWADGMGMAQAELILGEIRVIQKRHLQAEAPLLKSWDLWNKQPVPQNSKLRETVSYLVRTYEGLNQPEKVAKFRQQLKALSK